MTIDKIYCIHMIDAKDRYDNIMKEFKKMKFDNIEFINTFNKSVFNDILKQFININDNEYLKKMLINFPLTCSAVFDCVWNHYKIAKLSYIQEFNNILVFEDDMTFLCSKNQFDHILNHAPKNYDVIKLDTWNITEVLNDNHINNNCELFRLMEGESIYSGAYIMSRTGMEKYIKIVENQILNKNLWPADIIFNMFEDKLIYEIKYKIMGQFECKSYIQNYK